jgi:pimeloyl-ACP methyl ester carboxylesterase
MQASTVNVSEISVIPVGDIELAWQAFGDPGDPAVLLIMGLGMQLLGWPEGLCASLAAQGYYVIRFDNRDVGQSTWLTEEGVPDIMSLMHKRLLHLPMRVPYTLSDMAGDAAGLLDALGIEAAHIVGGSMGGMIAQVFALEHPERTLTLSSLMSTTGDHGLPGPTPRAMAVMMLPTPINLETYISNSLKTWAVFDGSRYRGSRDYILSRVHMNWARKPNSAGFARQFAAVMASPPRTLPLKRLQIPTLVLHGKDDPMVPVACGRHTAACIPNSTLKIVDGMGHTMPPSLWPLLTDHLTAHWGAHGDAG